MSPARSARTSDQVLVGVDPGTLGKLLEQRAIETARGAVIDIFDGGLMAQPGVAQAGVQPPVASVAGLLVEQQGEPFGMGRAPRLHRMLRSRRRPWPCRQVRADEAGRGWDG